MLDLGFNEYKKIAASVESENAINSAQPRLNWKSDLMVINLLSQVTPVFDATMFRFYAEKFNINIEDESEEDLQALANLYKHQIELFVISRMKELVCKIVDRWEKFVDTELTIPHLPSAAKKAFGNFLMLVKNTTSADMTSTFNTFYTTLADACQPRNTNTFDLAHISETVNKDQFKTYLTICRSFIDKAFTIKEDTEFSKFMYAFKYIQQVVKSILWMCRLEYDEYVYDYAKWYSTSLIYMRIKDSEQAMSGLGNRKSIPIVYTLFITPENIKDVPEDKDSYPITDSFRLLSVLLYQYYKVNKEC